MFERLYALLNHIISEALDMHVHMCFLYIENNFIGKKNIKNAIVQLIKCKDYCESKNMQPNEFARFAS